MVQKHRRNFLPTFVINLFLWLIWFLIVFKATPNYLITIAGFNLPINLILFFFVLTLSLGLTLALVFGNTRRGLFLTLFFESCLLLRLIKQATWLNLILLLGFFLTSEFYFLSREKGKS